MHLHLEKSLQRDIDLIRARLVEMGEGCQRAVRGAVEAFLQRNRMRAWAVVIRDQRIDALEKEIDRLCLEYLVRQQPAGGLLRFAYSSIKINGELERVGDCAESIAHQAAKLCRWEFEVPAARFQQMADLAVRMLGDAVRAFLAEDVALARATIETEDTVDALKTQLRTQLVQAYRDGRLPFEALDPCLTITRRLERVSDEARDMCLETLYLCTGEYAKHPGTELYRVLFLDRHDAGAGPMAEAIGSGLRQPKFRFVSAGLDPRPLHEATRVFLRQKGFDLERRAPRSLTQVPELDRHQVIVALTPEVRTVLPRAAHNHVQLDWAVEDPATVEGSAERVQEVLGRTYTFLETQIRALVDAVLEEEGEKGPDGGAGRAESA